MKHLFMTLAVLAVSAAWGAAPSDAGASLDFERMEGAVFYTVHKGGDLSLKLETRYRPGKYFVRPALLATLYDPEEHAVKDFYLRPEADRPSGVIEYPVKNAAPGLWTLRIAQSKDPVMIGYRVAFTPSEGLGFMPARCWVWHRDTAKLDGGWFLVPPGGKDVLSVYRFQCRVEIFDAEGKSAACLEKDGSFKVPLKEGGVYRLKVSASAPGWNWVPR